MDGIGAILHTVRDRLGLSQATVGERLHVSSSLISKWEKGERTPDSGQVAELARVFGVCPDFLLGTRQKTVFQSRARTSMPADERHRIGAALNDAAQRIHFIHKAWDLAGRTPSRVALRLDWADPDLSRHCEVVRSMLKLNRRINLAELKQALAENNVLVFDWHLPAKLFGLCYRGDFSVIFLNRALPEPQRLFTLAHELSHLIYHLSDVEKEVSDLASRNDPKEKQANRFASELLLPEADLAARVEREGKRIKEPAVFHRIAREWNVSPEALFYRLAVAEKMKWSDSGRFYTRRPVPERMEPHRVTSIAEQVAREVITAGLAAWRDERVSGGKLAEWWFSALEKADDFLFKADTVSDDDQITLALSGGDPDIA